LTLIIELASGKDVKFASVPEKAFAGMAGEEITEMLAYFGEFGCEYFSSKA